MHGSNQRGFTFIEMIVVMATLSCVAAIVVPRMAEMKKRSFDRSAEVNLRLVAAAEEAYFERYEAYRSCTQADCAAILEGLQQIDSGVALNVTVSGESFSGTAYHQQGSGQVFHWN